MGDPIVLLLLLPSGISARYCLAPFISLSEAVQFFLRTCKCVHAKAAWYDRHIIRHGKHTTQSRCSEV